MLVQHADGITHRSTNWCQVPAWSTAHESCHVCLALTLLSRHSLRNYVYGLFANIKGDSRQLWGTSSIYKSSTSGRTDSVVREVDCHAREVEVGR